MAAFKGLRNAGNMGVYRAKPNREASGAVDRYARSYRVDRRWLMFGEGSMDGKGADRILEGLDDDDKARNLAAVMRFIDFVRRRKAKIRQYQGAGEPAALSPRGAAFAGDHSAFAEHFTHPKLLDQNRKGHRQRNRQHHA